MLPASPLSHDASGCIRQRDFFAPYNLARLVILDKATAPPFDYPALFQMIFEATCRCVRTAFCIKLRGDTCASAATAALLK